MDMIETAVYSQNRTFYRVPKSRIHKGKQGIENIKGYRENIPGTGTGFFLLWFSCLHCGFCLAGVIFGIFAAAYSSGYIGENGPFMPGL